MTTGRGQEKMIYALNGMRRGNKNHSRYETKITSRVYDLYKQHAAKLLSAINKGKTWNHTEEAKAKISKANTGVIRNDEFKSKVSKVHKGKIETLETKVRKSLSHIGNRHSDETIQKMSANSGRAVTVVIDGIFYKSKRLAAQILFPELSGCTAIRRINKML